MGSVWNVLQVPTSSTLLPLPQIAMRVLPMRTASGATEWHLSLATGAHPTLL